MITSVIFVRYKKIEKIKKLKETKPFIDYRSTILGEIISKTILQIRSGLMIKRESTSTDFVLFLILIMLGASFLRYTDKYKDLYPARNGQSQADTFSRNHLA